MVALTAVSLLPGIVHADPATHYKIITGSTAVSYNNTEIVIQALDASNNLDTSFSGPAIISSSDPYFIGCGNSVPFTNGQADNNGYAFKMAGVQTVTPTMRRTRASPVRWP